MAVIKPVAIVGLGAIFPDANSPLEFWENIKKSRSSISEVPENRWDPGLYFDPDPAAPDKTYSKIGGWVRGFKLEPFKYGLPIPPTVLAQMDEVQQWAVEACRQALQDYDYPRRALDPSRVAVILGNAMGGENHTRNNMRIFLPEYAQAFSSSPAFQALSKTVQDELLSAMQEKIRAGIPAISEDTMPGELSNIIAGRVANLFNFTGPNYVTDAACASSLAALQTAVEGLNAGAFDAVLTGGVDRNMGVESFVKFCKIGALSADGSRPYSDGANGFVMGEGAGVFLIKRLEDAERAGDKIYAVVRGIGGSSDGKGKGITAPNPTGQQLAIQRAWTDAAVSPASAGLIEGHGTSTKVGDVVEVTSLNAIFGKAGLPAGAIALGSVKSNIGHTKSAAGAAGLLKTTLALYEKVLPPSANFTRPNPNLDFSALPFYVNTQIRPWERAAGEIRRAGVSSFGFGGTNFHVILEEYIPGMNMPDKPIFSGATFEEAVVSITPNNVVIASTAVVDASIRDYVLNTVAEKTGYPQDMLDMELDLEADLGIDTVKQAELFAHIREHFGIPRREDLRLAEYNTLTKVVQFVQDGLNKTAPAGLPAAAAEISAPAAPMAVSDARNAYRRSFLFLGAADAPALKTRLTKLIDAARRGILPQVQEPAAEDLRQPERLAFDYGSPEEFVKRAEKALQAFDSDKDNAFQNLSVHGIQRASGNPGKLAFLFPGQGSQYVNMMREFAESEDVVRETYAEADEVMRPLLGKPLTSYIFADGDEASLKAAEAELKNTAITQPAVLSADVALLRLMKKYRIVPDMVIGHSLGEYAALVAAGVLSFPEALEVVSARGREMTKVSMDDNGAMAAVSAPLEEVERLLKTIDGYVIIANINSPVQSVIAGATRAVEEAIAAFQAGGFQAVKLPVSHAFHTKIVAPASIPLRATIARMNLQSPRIPIAANVTGAAYPLDRGAILDLLAEQVTAPVQFVRGIEYLYAQGARVFVEVGPKRVLSALATGILKEKSDTLVLATNHPNKGATVSFMEALCGLYAAGYPLENGGKEAAIEIRTALTTFTCSKPPIDLNGSLPLTGSVVISGAGLGLPGLNRNVFADDNIASLLRGDMRIEALSDDVRQRMVDKRITRLEKNDAGALMVAIDSLDGTVKLGGQRGEFNLNQEFGVPEERVEALDITSRLAMAAGIEALRDAGIPLVMNYRKTSQGTYLPDRWMLPVSMMDETGVIFASAFPGLERMAEENQSYYTYTEILHRLSDLRALLDLAPAENRQFIAELEGRIADLEKQLAENDYHFDRRFIFRVLTMGHSQFAEYIGARGPNTHVNAACATTTHAISVAEDWIRAGRCRRVVIIAGDDVTAKTLGGWVGSGMLASGASSIETDVRKAVLPFDRRRNGLVMGMGAAGLVVEAEDAVRERGMRGIAELVSSQIANSAYHGTRLDTKHVGDVMERLMDQAERRFGIKRNEIAAQTVFISHETYTPARGGSASAEIRALRQTFQESADRVVIANTKGYTGHAMGVGIEDVLAVKALEFGTIPPIAYIDDGFEPDPELGNLNLSRGGTYPVEFSLRLGAGFGSQIAMTLLRKVPGSAERVNQPVYQAWLSAISGYAEPEMEIQQRTLRIKHAGPPQTRPVTSQWHFGQGPTAWAYVQPAEPAVQNLWQSAPAPAAQPVPDQPVVIPAVRIQPAADEEIQKVVLGLVSEKTGYPVEMLDLELDLEADLGIDTVKQAELFAAVRQAFGIPRKEDLKLADYNTLTKVVGFVKEMQGQNSTPVTAAPIHAQVPVEPSAPARQATATTDENIKAVVLGLVSEKTGYPVEMLDLELDLEADLGIDTVKQAELFAAVRQAFGIPRKEDLKLADYNTLTKVIGFVKEADPNRTDASAPAEKEEIGVDESPSTPLEIKSVEEEDESEHHPEGVSEPQTGGVVRRVPAAVLRPRLNVCLPTGIVLGKESRVVILSDQGKVGDALTRKLRALHAEVLVLKETSADYLRERVSAWLEKGPVQGLYFLPNLDGKEDLLSLTPAAFQAELERNLYSLERLLRVLPDLAFVIGATRMDGLHGFSGGKLMAPLGGTAGGMLKAMRREREGLLVKVVDFDGQASANDTAARLIDETLKDPAAVEIGWQGEQRFGVTLRPKEVVPAEPVKLGDSPVYLVSGGSGGITIPVVLDLARTGGGRFYLLGRHAQAQADDADLRRVLTDRQGLKMDLLNRKRDAGLKAKPAEIEKELAALERSARTLQALETIRSLGGRATYLACDVTDPGAVEAAVGALMEKEGRLDVLIHAAGYEHSGKLESKSSEEFRQVIDVKAGGFFNLLKGLQKHQARPKAVIGFSSVAGRLGNAGQSDYSAANEGMSRMMAAVRQADPSVKTLVIDWGAWAEVGMASRGSVPEIMRRAGIDMLETEAAAPLLRREIENGCGDPEIVLAGRLGILEKEDALPGISLDVEAANRALTAGKPSHIMLSRVTGYDLDEGVTLEAELDPREHPLLMDHAIQGIPVLPGVAGIEGFAVATQHIVSGLAAEKGGFRVTGLENIQFRVPFKFYRNEPRRITWKAQVVRQEEGLVTYAELLSTRIRPGRAAEIVRHFSGIVHLVPAAVKTKELTVRPPHWNGGFTVNAADIYRLYFHGPSFQVLEGVQRDGDTILGKLNPVLPGGEKGGLLSSIPMLVELCMQTAGVWEIGASGVLALPKSIGQLEIYDPKPNGVPIFAEVRPHQDAHGQTTFDARVVDEKGRLFLDIKEYCTIPVQYKIDPAWITPLQGLAG